MKNNKTGILLISGRIASGKTTLVRELCHGMKIGWYLECPRKLEPSNCNVLVFEDIDASFAPFIKRHIKRIRVPVICTSLQLISSLPGATTILVWRPSASEAAKLVDGANIDLARRFDCDLRQMKIALQFGDKAVGTPDKSRLSIPDAIKLAFKGKGVIEDVTVEMIYDNYLKLSKDIQKAIEYISLADTIGDGEVQNCLLEYGLNPAH